MRFKLTPLFKAIVLGLSLDASAALANPEGGEVVAGEAAINREDSRRLNITQGSNKAIINWQSFNIAADESVNITTPTMNAVTLNRVTGGNASDIEGQLHSTGQVWLINPNGILFGQHAQVSAAGLLASTLNITNDNFMKGDYKFTQDSTANAKIINHGQLNSEQGYVAMLAPQIENSGIVSAKLGTVVMAAGTEATVTFEGNHLLNIEVPQGASVPMYDEDGNPVAALSSTGSIEADGGHVLLTAESVNTLLDQSINLSGIIKADTVEQTEGKIVLTASRNLIITDGKLSAKGLNAGEKGGDIQVLGRNQVVLTGDTTLNASGAAAGGDIRVGKDARVQNGTEAALTRLDSNVTLNAGSDGFVETSGATLDLKTTHVNAGTLLLDPYNVTISDTTTSSGGFFNGDTIGDNTYIATGTSIISVDTIIGLLARGTSVHITTAGGGAEAGNIVVDSAITPSITTGTPTLTFDAAGKIFINQAINGGNNLNLTLNGVDDIEFNAAVTVGTLTARTGTGTGNISQSSTGAITAVQTNLMVPTGSINLTAADNVLGTLNATAGNVINIKDTGTNLILGTLDTHYTNSDISVTTSGELSLGNNGGAYINVGTGVVTLNGLNINDNLNNNETIIAGATHLNAANTAGYISLNGNNYFGTLSANAGGSTGSGANGIGIKVTDINPNGLVLDQINASGGIQGSQNANIQINAKNGDITFADTASIATSGYGNILLTADQGSITDHGGATEVIHSSGTTTLTANNNIELGGSNLFGKVNATATAGNISLNDSAQLSLGTLNANTISLTADTLTDGGAAASITTNTLNLTATNATTAPINLAATDLSTLQNLSISLPNVTNALTGVTFNSDDGLGGLTGLTISTPNSALNVSDLTASGKFIPTNRITRTNITTFGLTSNSVVDSDITNAVTDFGNLENVSLGKSGISTFTLNQSDLSSHASLQSLSLTANDIYIAPGGASAGTLTLPDDFTLNLTATGNGAVLFNPNPTIQATNLQLNVSLPNANSNTANLLKLGNFSDLTGLSINVPNDSYNVSNLGDSVISASNLLTSLSITSKNVGANDLTAKTTFANLTSLALDNTNTTAADFRIVDNPAVNNLTLATGGNITLANNFAFSNLTLAAGGTVTANTGDLTVNNNLNVTGAGIIFGGALITVRGGMNLTATAGDISSGGGQFGFQLSGNATLNASGDISLVGNLDLSANKIITAAAGGDLTITNYEGGYIGTTVGTLTLGAITAGGNVTLSNNGTYLASIADVNLTGSINAGGDVIISSTAADPSTQNVALGITNNSNKTINMGYGHNLTVTTNNSGASAPNFGFHNNGTIGNGVDPFTLNLISTNTDPAMFSIALGTLSAGSTANNKGFNLNINTRNMDMTVDDLVNAHGLSTSANIQSLDIISQNTSDTDITNALSGSDHLTNLTGLSLENTSNTGFAISGGDYSQLTGGLTLRTGSGNITQTSAITNAPAELTLTAKNITLAAQGNKLGKLSVSSDQNTTLNAADDSLLNLDGASVQGNLTITSGGNSSVMQGGSIFVAGTTNINVGTGEITLNHPVNYFTGLVDLTGGSISLSNSLATQLNALTASGSFSLIGDDDITQASGINMTNAGSSANFQINNGSNGIINLDNATNHFNGNIINIGGAGTVGNVTIVNDDSSLELGNINTSGTLSVTTGGDIEQNSAITTTGGAVSITAGGDFSQSVDGSINTAGSDSSWGNIMLLAGTGNVSTGAITLDGIIEGNAINITNDTNSTGNITQNSTIISNDIGITGISILNNGTGDIIQNSSGSMALTFEDSPAEGSNLGIKLTASSGKITQSGSLNAEKSAATLHSEAGKIIQNDEAGNLGSITAGSTYISGIDSVDLSGSNALGTLSVSSSGDLTVNDSSNNGLMLGNVATEGNIKITAHSLLQKTDTAITMSGTGKTARFIVNEGGSVTLNNTSNNFGANAVSVVGTNNKAAGTVEINDTNTTGLELDMIKSGALTANATGALRQQGDITATGNVNLIGAAISSYADLDAGSNSINLTTMDGNIISGNNAVLFNNGTVTASDLNITTASGAITQSGIIHSTGTMTINASDGKQDNGNSINLTNPNNLLGTVTITHASDVNLAGKNGYTISGITSTGNISAQTNYGLDPSVQATGTLSITGNVTAGGSINLGNEITNATYGIDVTNTGSLFANSDITLITSSSENGLTNNGINIEGNIHSNGGNISIFDNRSYGQTPDSSYAANMSIAGMIDATTGSIQIEDFGAGTITLENNGVVDSNEITLQGNALTLGGSLTGNNINLNSKSNLSLGNITAANNFMVSSFGAVTQASNTTLDITGTTTIGGQSNDVTLNNENHFHDAVSIIGNNISVTQGEANGDLSLGNLNAFGDVMVSAKGGSLILNGSTPNITLRNGTSDKTVTLIVNQLQNNNNNAIDLGTGANAWHIYLTQLNGNAFGGLSSGQQAIWGTSYPTSISQTGNRYIFATTENLTLSPLADPFAITKTVGDIAELPTPTPGTYYQVSGFVNASNYDNAFTQDTVNNTTINNLHFTSSGTPTSAEVGHYTIDMNGAATVDTGYNVSYDDTATFGELTVEAVPTPPTPVPPTPTPVPPTPTPVPPAPTPVEPTVPSSVDSAVVGDMVTSEDNLVEQKNKPLLNGDTVRIVALQKLLTTKTCSLIDANILCTFTLAQNSSVDNFLRQNEDLVALLANDQLTQFKTLIQQQRSSTEEVTIYLTLNANSGTLLNINVTPAIDTTL